MFCTTKVRDELLEIGKDMKVMHSVSSLPTKYGRTFFVKKLCMRKQTFLGKFMGGMFYMETTDQIMQRGKIFPSH